MKILKKASCVLAMAIVISAVSAVLPVQAETMPKGFGDVSSLYVTVPEATVEETVELVNAQRKAAGLAPLTWNDQLASDASIRAKECAASYAHTRPDGSDWWTVDSDLMYGENLASGYTTASSVVDAWMASPAHKANIMNSGYTTIGLATYTTESGDIYWAEEFGY